MTPRVKLTIEDYRQVLAIYDKGVLSRGAHRFTDGAYCALECDALARYHEDGKPFDQSKFSDAPGNLPDIRLLNDGPWSSDEARTHAMLRLMAALSDWRVWPASRKRAFTDRVIIRTVNRIISGIPYLPEDLRKRCRDATSTVEAMRAAGVTLMDSPARLEWIVGATTSAARAGKAEAVLLTAVDIWIEAATATEHLT